MKILVCIKPVKKHMISECVELCEKYCINPYDMFALNEAIKIKGSYSNISVDCVCMGADDSVEVLRRCLALGADDVYLLSDSLFAGSDTIATSYTLSRFIETHGYDYVFCGCKSIDGETGQVVYGLSERLKFECITKVANIISVKDNSIEAIRIGDEFDEHIITDEKKIIVFKDFSIETSISLIAIKRAGRKNINILSAEDLSVVPANCGQKGSKTQIVGTIDIVEKRKCQFLNRDIDENCSFLNKILEETVSEGLK